MKIVIDDDRKIHVLQEEFSTMFPWLKLEFFSRPHNAGGASPKKEMVPSSRTLGQARTIHDSGTITVTPSMTVTALEQAFREIYGLSVQVFRKSGKSWLETTVTDGWTLEHQNTQGKMLSEVH
jgi:hypothetical protein